MNKRLQWFLANVLILMSGSCSPVPPAGEGGPAQSKPQPNRHQVIRLFTDLEPLLRNCAKVAGVSTEMSDERSQSFSGGGKQRTFRLNVTGTPEAIDRMMRTLRSEIQKTAGENKIAIVFASEENGKKQPAGLRFTYAAVDKVEGKFEATLDRGKRMDGLVWKIEPAKDDSYIITVEQEETAR